MIKKYTFFVLFFCQFLAAQYSQPYFPYYSQAGQDKFVNEKLFHNKKKGIFVDVGAHDGISYSNSYYFEKELGWTGICVEPHPSIFPQLKENRNAICYQVCAGNNDGVVQFIKVDGAPEMLSGIVNSYDPRHLARLKHEINLYGGSYEIVNIPSRTLSTLFEENNLFEIDFLSIDVEGSEKEVLEGIDFNKYKIKCILVEKNYPDKFDDIVKLLIANRYIHFASLDIDEVFILAE
jgi:FkbM family methyltransferase